MRYLVISNAIFYLIFISSILVLIAINEFLNYRDKKRNNGK